MKTTLSFTVSIAAPRRLVWKTILGPDGYKAWTSTFTKGSYFVGLGTSARSSSSSLLAVMA